LPLTFFTGICTVLVIPVSRIGDKEKKINYPSLNPCQGRVFKNRKNVGLKPGKIKSNQIPRAEARGY
jgi:hypothetical protein